MNINQAESVYVALPSYKGVVTSAMMMTTAYTTAMLVARGFDPILATLSMPDIAKLRNLFLSVWMEKTQAKYILFIDDDMEFNPDLVPAMIDLNEPVVGAVYPHKGYPLRFVFNGNLHPDKRIEHPSDQRFAQVNGIGFGCTLIRRDAIETMLNAGLSYQTENIDRIGIGESLKSIGALKKFIHAFNPIKAPDGVEISEDYSFCQRWTQTGGKIWAAIGWEIGHVGPHVWRGQFNQFGSDGTIQA